MSTKVMHEAVSLNDQMEEHRLHRVRFIEEDIDKLVNGDRFDFENYLDKETLREFDRKKFELEEQLYDLRAHHTFIALETAYPQDAHRCLCRSCRQ